MIQRLTFAEILREERLREYNQCHTPGGPTGGQFCSTGGGGSALDSTYVPKPGESSSSTAASLSRVLMAQEKRSRDEQLKMVTEALEAFDQRVYKRHLKNPRVYYNINAQTLYKEAAVRMMQTVASGVPLDRALATTFEGPVLAHLQKWIAKHGR